MRPTDLLRNGCRLLFLDIVGAGAGGPDFRLGAGQRAAIARALAEADAAGTTPIVFMHAYPSDLADGGEALATLFAEAGVAFVDTGHTHYNELLNDGRVVYGAARSIAQIEEAGGQAGYAIVSVHDGVASWTFRPIDGTAAAWPHVQIVAPSDIRLLTRPHDPRQVPATGPVEIVARLLGAFDGVPEIEHAGMRTPMTAMPELAATWRAEIAIGSAGLHPVTVHAGAAHDRIELLVRDKPDRPKPTPLTAPGNAIHGIGAWPSRHILGTRLGPNRFGCGW